MFYSKLPIMFLSEIVSSDGDSTNGRLASYILEHIDEVKQDSIRDLAAKTYVSISSISRFCRDIGLQDFTQLKALLSSTSLNFEVCSQSDSPQQQKLDYISAVQDSLGRVRDSLGMGKLYQLAQDIRRYQRISIFGMLKAETAAMNLQSDLVMLGKQAVTKVRVAQQMDYLAHTDEDDLVIIFSFTGIYFDYGIPQGYRSHRKKRPRVYFITSGRNLENTDLYDEVIWFDSVQDQASHPYQLQLVASLIAQCYAHLIQDASICTLSAVDRDN